MSRTGTTPQIVAFTPAAPGWRMWGTWDGHVEEIALASWVIVAKIHDHVASSGRTLQPEEQFEEIGVREIRPAWFDLEWGQLMFKGDLLCPDNYKVRVTGPGEDVPSPDELAQWAREVATRASRS